MARSASSRASRRASTKRPRKRSTSRMPRCQARKWRRRRRRSRSPPFLPYGPFHPRQNSYAAPGQFGSTLQTVAYSVRERACQRRHRRCRGFFCLAFAIEIWLLRRRRHRRGHGLAAGRGAANRIGYGPGGSGGRLWPAVIRDVHRASPRSIQDRSQAVSEGAAACRRPAQWPTRPEARTMRTCGAHPNSPGSAPADDAGGRRSGSPGRARSADRNRRPGRRRRRIPPAPVISRWTLAVGATSRWISAADPTSPWTSARRRRAPPPHRAAVLAPSSSRPSSRADGEPIATGMTWRVFSSEPGPDGKLKTIGVMTGGHVNLKLRPGVYFVHAAYGRAGVTRKITVTDTVAGDTVILNAGGLRLSALVGKDQAPRCGAGQLRHLCSRRGRIGRTACCSCRMRLPAISSGSTPAPITSSAAMATPMPWCAPT